MDFGSSGSGVVREAEPYQVNDEGEEDQNGDRSVSDTDNVINILTLELFTSTALWALSLSLKDVTMRSHWIEQISMRRRILLPCLIMLIEVVKTLEIKLISSFRREPCSGNRRHMLHGLDC